MKATTNRGVRLILIAASGFVITHWMQGKTAADVTTAPVVTSTAQPSPSPRARTETSQASARSRVISMSFEKADLTTVLKLLGKAAGVTMAISPQVQGTITIASTEDVPIAEAFDIVNSILRVKGFTMIGTLKDRVIQVVPLKDAVTSGTGVGVGAEEASIASGDTIVTQIVNLKHADAAKLKSDLTPMLSKDNAAIVSNAESNSLVITDSRSNVKRILSVIRELDKDVSDVIALEVIYLQHANAPSIAEMLTSIFGEKPAGPRPGQPQMMPPPEGGPPKVASEKGFVELRGQVKIAADSRTNSLVVSASQEKIELIKGLIEKLDKDVNPDVKVKIFPLKNADATSLAEELNQIFEQPQGGPEGRKQARMPWDWYFQAPTTQGAGKPGLAGLKENYVVADVRSNSLIVTAREENMSAFEKLIETLDRERSLNEVTHVYRLLYAKASDLADSLNNLFQGGNLRGGFWSFLYRLQTSKEGPLSTLKEVTVVAEPKSNSLIVTGPPQVFDTISRMIEELDKQQSQVFIEVLIVDVTLDDTTQLGVEWTLASGEHTASTSFGTAARTTGLKYSVVGSRVTALLQTLIEKHKVKVLSTPHITTVDNVEANIEIGQSFPAVQAFLPQPNGQAIPQFGPTKITTSLTVTPHITSGKFITMDIHQTINDLQSTILQGGFQMPVISVRDAKTSVSVEDGQTIVIGGMMKDSKNTTTRKVPILGDIPFLGHLFRDDEVKKSTSELMVFLTPHVVTSQAEADRITQEQKNKLREGSLPEKKSTKK